MLCLEATPLFAVGSMIFIIDTVLILFYLWAAVGVLEGLWAGEKKLGFYRAGIASGAGPPIQVHRHPVSLAALLFFLFSRERGKAFRNPHLYLALLLGLLVFSPFVYWNMTHGWISLGIAIGKRPDRRKELEPGVRILVWTTPDRRPGALFLFSERPLGRHKKIQSRGPLCLSGLIDRGAVLVFGLAAFKGKYSDPTWTDIGWPFGAILVGKYFSDRLSKESESEKGAFGRGPYFCTGWLPIDLIAVHSFFPFLPVAAHE